MSNSNWSGWFNRKDKEPSKDLEYIIVLGKCGIPHSAVYIYNCWHSPQNCYFNEGHRSFYAIDFDYWTTIPEPDYGN